MSYNDKRIQIIETAEELFANKGFDGTSIRDISQASNMNLAMVSYYFGSKHKLLEAIFEYRIQSTYFHLGTLTNDENDQPLQKIYAIIDHYTDQLFNNKSFYKLMQLKHLKQVENVEVQNIINLSNKKNYELISSLILQGQKQGFFNKEIDTSMIVSTLTGTSSQILFNQVSYKKEHGLESMEEEEFQLLLKRKIRSHLKSILKKLIIQP